MDAARIRALIRQQFATAAELTRLTGRPFTLDGHTSSATTSAYVAANPADSSSFRLG
jgi:hypothetical protein